MNQIINAHHGHAYFHSSIAETPSQNSPFREPACRRNQRGNGPLSKEIQNAYETKRAHHTQSVNTTTSIEAIQKLGVEERPSHAISVVLQSTKDSSFPKTHLTSYRKCLVQGTQNPQDMSIDCEQFVPHAPRYKHSPQTNLFFHRNYLINRMRNTQYTASGSQLFKEIQAKGYRGSLKHVKNFLSMIRKNERPLK